MIRSVRGRLILGNTAILAAILLLFGLAIQEGFHAFTARTIDNELVRRSRRHIPQISPPPGAEREFANGPLVFNERGQADFFGQLVGPWDPVAFSNLGDKRRTFTEVTTQDNRHLRVMTQFMSEGRTLQVAYPMADIDTAAGQLNMLLLALAPVALLLSVFGGFVLTNNMLGRMGQITKAATQIDEDDLTERLPDLGDDEFGELTKAFNGLLDRLEAAFNRQGAVVQQLRRFTADASHELKTPLTVIKGNATLGMQPGQDTQTALSEINRAADGMSNLVQDLLLLARSDSGQLDLERKTLNLDDLLRDAARSVPNPKDVAVDVRASGLHVLGDQAALLRLFSNLIHNAVRHTAPENAILIHSLKDSAFVKVEVIDSGEGISKEHLAHLGERFYRVEKSRARQEGGGTGLGLAICFSIVEASNGWMEITSDLGVGTKVTVWLPRAEPALGASGQKALNP
ncbi:MAG: HAMP domain-containing histidine kinase [Armatimonadetes bacterium]|nr:HAMP domain-containing histidine kinase [Armatimonadota bacterium]